MKRRYALIALGEFITLATFFACSGGDNLSNIISPEPSPAPIPQPSQAFSGRTTSTMPLIDVLRNAGLNVTNLRTSNGGRRFVGLDGSPNTDWNIWIDGAVYGLGASGSLDMPNVTVPAGSSWVVVRA